jgi:protein-disulfide isomerase
MKKLSLILVFLVSIAMADEGRDGIFDAKYNSDIHYGNSDAKVEVFEYYSLTCHHCAHFYASNFLNLKKDYIDTGKVKWIKRSYAMDDAAISATKLLECVDNTRRESYVKILLSKQSSWAYGKAYLDILSNIAALGGMNRETFDKCMAQASLDAEIRKRAADARTKLEISGTPTFFVNREKVSAYTEDSFRKLLDKQISEVK